MDNDLLRPTLSGYRQAPALYSSTGFFVSSFFGGPVGAAIFGACNSWRLGRLRSDLPLLVAVAAAAFLAVLLMRDAGWVDAVAAFLGAPQRRACELLLRGFAIACFGAIYFMHRAFFRAARVSGMKSPSSWGPGIAALVLGILANMAFIRWILQHH